MKIAELLKICICHEKDEWCVYVFNKIIGVTRYFLQNLTSKNAQFLFFFTKLQVHQTAGAASFPCGLRAGTNVWLDTGKIIQFHMTRIQPVRSRAIYCHQADNQPFYYYQILGRNFGGFQTQFGHFTEIKRHICLRPLKATKITG